MFSRTLQLNELLKREISKILLKEQDFGRDVLATVTRVEVSPDLGEAKVYISVFPQEQKEKIMETLQKNIYHTQQKLNKKLNLKKIPKIIFQEEKKLKQAGRVEELIEEIRKKKE